MTTLANPVDRPSTVDDRRDGRYSGCVVDVYCGMDGLEALEEHWQAITTYSRNVEFYHRYEWYHAYLGCLESSPDDVHFFLIREGRNPVAIIPLRREQFRCCGMDLKAWVTPRDEQVAIYDFITTDTSQVRACFRAVLDKLQNEDAFGFDVIFLKRIVEGGNAWQMSPTGYRGKKILTRHSSSKFIECGCGKDGRQPGGSTKFKRNLRRLAGRLERKGEVTWDFVGTDDEQWQAYQDFLEVESAGWKGKSGTGTAINCQPGAKKFYGELVKSFGKLGLCRINLLRLDGEVIAGQFCLLDKNRINLLKVGYRGELRDTGPGYLLVREVFQDGCTTDDFSTLSFVTGPAWVDAFAPGSTGLFSVDLPGNTFRGQLYYWRTRAWRFVKPRLRKMQDKFPGRNRKRTE